MEQHRCLASVRRLQSLNIYTRIMAPRYRQQKLESLPKGDYSHINNFGKCPEPPLANGFHKAQESSKRNRNKKSELYEGIFNEFSTPNGHLLQYDLTAPNDQWVITQLDSDSLGRQFDDWTLFHYGKSFKQPNGFKQIKKLNSDRKYQSSPTIP